MKVPGMRIDWSLVGDLRQVLRRTNIPTSQVAVGGCLIDFVKLYLLQGDTTVP